MHHHRHRHRWLAAVRGSDPQGLHGRYTILTGSSSGRHDNRGAAMRRSYLGASGTQGLGAMGTRADRQDMGARRLRARRAVGSLARPYPAGTLRHRAPRRLRHRRLLAQRETTAHRSPRSSATPIRRECTICSAADDAGVAAQRCCPRITSHPFSARPIAKACPRLPGPVARAARRLVPRRRCITSRPASGCTARSKTAFGVSSAFMTMFTQACTA
jgi:hypothetical protein